MPEEQGIGISEGMSFPDLAGLLICSGQVLGDPCCSIPKVMYVLQKPKGVCYLARTVWCLQAHSLLAVSTTGDDSLFP